MPRTCSASSPGSCMTTSAAGGSSERECRSTPPRSSIGVDRGEHQSCARRAAASIEKALLGIRAPGRFMLAVFRLPLHLYHRGWDRLLGHTFLVFVHAGRKTGTPHEAIAMVLRFDE